MNQIQPTQNFVLIQFMPKRESTILLPDGHLTSNGGDIVVHALGPDVPTNPSLAPGTKVLLRPDSMYNVYRVDEKRKLGLVDHKMILAIVNDAPEEALTNEQIDAIAAGTGN